MTNKEKAYNDALALYKKISPDVAFRTEYLIWFHCAIEYIDEMRKDVTLDKYESKILSILKRKNHQLLCQIYNNFRSKKDPVTQEFIQGKLDELSRKGFILSRQETNKNKQSKTYYYVPNYDGESQPKVENASPVTNDENVFKNDNGAALIAALKKFT